MGKVSILLSSLSKEFVGSFNGCGDTQGLEHVDGNHDISIISGYNVVGYLKLFKNGWVIEKHQIANPSEVYMLLELMHQDVEVSDKEVREIKEISNKKCS